MKADVNIENENGSTIHIEGTPAPHYTKEEEKRLMRRIDLHVMPWLCLTYALSLIDRTNIGAARVAGMEADLNLTGNRYSIVLMIFFITYIAVELPSNALIRRLGVKIYLPCLVAAWGVVAMCFGFLQNYGQTIALRILLGFFDGGPGCIFVISCWYKKYEVQRRLSIWFVSGSVISAFTGIFSYGLSRMDGSGGLEGWRWIFIVPGAVTAALALPLFYFIADFPERCEWLSPREREIMEFRRNGDGSNGQRDDEHAETQPEEEETATSGFLNAVTDWKVYAMSLLLMLPTAGSYSFAFFTPTILSTLGYSTALSQILTTPPYIFSAIVSICMGILADHLKLRSPFIIAHSLLAIVGIALIGWTSSTASRLVGIFLAITGNNCAIPAALAFLSNNVPSTSKRQFAVPLQTVFGGVGGIIGSLVFRAQDHPGYGPGLYATFACLGLNIAISAGLAVYFGVENRRKDTRGKVLEGDVAFRYTL
ncbi:major facilitator superfamily domain-containing protein [Aspergillus keveii]|uniref:Major facilitator superfamily domain-containing protein n=1 Tax=Aspergillus keveii TaxID=714993 RepID=A0ABR4G140_9EURO